MNNRALSKTWILFIIVILIGIGVLIRQHFKTAIGTLPEVEEISEKGSSDITSKNKTFVENGIVFKEIRNSYDETYSPAIIGGKLWYTATERDKYNRGRDHLIADGKEVPISGEDVRIECLKALGDKPAYFVSYRKSLSSFEDYLQYGDKKYKGLECPEFRENGVHLWDGKVLVYYRGKKKLIVDGKPYDSDKVFFVKMVEGKPVYYKDKDGKQELFYGKKKIPLYGHDPDYLSDVVVIDGKIALNFYYPILCSSNTYCSPGSGKIIFNGKEIEDPRYESMEHIFKYKNALAYVARTKSGDYVIVSNNVEISPGHKEIEYPQEIDGKLVYFANDGKGYSLYYDNKRKSNYYYLIMSNVVKIGDQLAFIALKEPPPPREWGEKVIVYGGKEFGKQYDTIANLLDYNGRLMYEGIKNYKRVIVLETTKEEKNKTKITAHPIERPFKAVVVTANVGHIPKSCLNTGCSFQRPFMKLFIF